MKRYFWFFSSAFLVIVLSACSVVAPLDDAVLLTQGDVIEANVLQTTALSDQFDSFKTAVFEKADWANGGFFNCGWKPDHVTFANSKMNIKLDDLDSHGKPFTSGEYRTKNTFKYGKYQCNLKAVKKSGVVTAFFTYNASPWDEIDVEILGKDTTKVQFNYFVNGVGGHETMYSLGFDASAAFHKYEFDWRSGWIKWYVDGVLARTVNTGARPSNAGKIMMNFWPGTGVDSWLGSFTYTTPLTASYDIVKYTP